MEPNSSPNAKDKAGSADRMNFLGGLWHGAFYVLGVSLTQPTTVISSFIAELTSSTIWVGGLSTVLTVASTLPQLFVARLIEGKPRKMPYLLIGIYLRVASWGVLAWLIHMIGKEKPQTLAWVMVGLLAVFYAGGGFANIPYTDIIGKVIPPDRRGAFFGGKQALAGPLAIGAALIAQRILTGIDSPASYALLFGLASLSLAIASLGFWMIRENPAQITEAPASSWSVYWKQISRTGKNLKQLIWIELFTGFSLMSLPFYILYARENVGAPIAATGWFMLAQVLGGLIANLVWARLVDSAGSRVMLAVCAGISALTPITAIVLSPFGWQAILVPFFLAGATFAGRSVGFQSALLEVAPPDERPTYAGVNQVLILPLAFLTFFAGMFLKEGSYTTIFLITAAFVSVGAVIAIQWARSSDANSGLIPEVEGGR